MKKSTACSCRIALSLLLFVGISPAQSEETNRVDASTNATPTERTSEELFEKLQREIAVQVARQTEAITSSLTEIGPALDRIQRQQSEASQNANRTLLIAAGLFTVAGFLGLGFLTMTSVRAMSRVSELALASSSAPRRALLPAPAEAAPPALNEPSVQPAVSGSVERASARFQGAIEQLEKRIVELEHSSHASPSAVRPDVLPAVVQAPMAPDTVPIHALPNQTSMLGNVTPPAPVSRADVLMGKGQALLNLDQPLAALECFAQVLSGNPDNTDALIRQGMAFEKLQEWERALQCYDRALALDDSLTLAHLHKGGVCNQLQRHREALECYEKALAVEPKAVAP